MYRDSVLSTLYERVGFPFDESELSPTLRCRVSDVVELREVLNRALSVIDRLNHSKENYWMYVLISGVAGFLFDRGTFLSLAFTVVGLLDFGTGLSSTPTE